MAKYIKKEDALPYLTKYIPSVEAVERAKIDKAIKDIELEKYYLRHEDTELDKMFDKGLDKALEILKRNIGE